MTTPREAAEKFLLGCLLGLGLGIWYEFLRPLRRKRDWPADTLFMFGAFWAWLYHGFAICQGDLRLGYSMGLPVGALLWAWLPGKLLRPINYYFWKLLAGIGLGILLPFEKFSILLKKLLHMGKNGLK